MEECVRRLTEQLAKDDWTVAQFEKLKSDWALVQVTNFSPFSLMFSIGKTGGA